MSCRRVLWTLGLALSFACDDADRSRGALMNASPSDATGPQSRDAGVSADSAMGIFDAAEPDPNIDANVLQNDDAALPGEDASTSADAGNEDAGDESDAGGDAGQPPPKHNVVFITSQTYLPSAIGGLTGADEKCNQLAEAADLEGTFVAWLSDSKTNAKDRLSSARGWTGTNGKPFVDTVAQLVTAKIWYPPNTNEHGAGVSSTVMTGTKSDGTKDPGSGGNFCANYSAAGTTGGVRWGGTEHWGAGWTAYGEQHLAGPIECNEAARFYCFQVDHQTPLSPDFPAHRVAFVSNNAISPANGIGAFDTACATNASAAGLLGTFKAFVATTSASAASRFNLSGLPWAQPSGVPIVAQAAHIGSANALLAPIQHFADGQSVQSAIGGVRVYTGATAPNVAGTPAKTCNNWAESSSGATYSRGRGEVYPAWWWSGPDGDMMCNTWSRVYCMQE